MIRIYDAAFGAANGKTHQDLSRFWWVDDNRNTGSWTRLEAHAFVAAHSRGFVYVSEGNAKVEVRAYHNDAGTKWIQTAADGIKKDNLTTLAQRHRQGLPNN